MTASSQRDGHNASNARLNKELLSKSSSGKYIWGGWCTDKMDIHQYLQVTLRLFRNPLYAFKWAVYFILLISNELKQSGRRRQQERQHNNFSWFLHVHHAFLYISLPSLHDYDVFGGREHIRQLFSFSIVNLDTVLQSSTPEKIANI